MNDLVFPDVFMPAVCPSELPQGAAVWCAFRGHQILVAEVGDTYYLPEWDQFQRSGLTATHQLYLGTLAQQPCYAVELSDTAEAPTGMTFINLRPLLFHLSRELFGVAGRAYQLISWHQQHQFCGRCGTAMQQDNMERVKRCPSCGLACYPRISPAVIMLIHRGSEVLLSRSPHHPKGMMTVQAGFVEAGESLEETVRREVWEEVGLSIKNVRYFASQSWPFPNSLMIGFTAEYNSGELAINTQELETGAWFAWDQLPTHLPPPMSIARSLIEWFVAKNRAEHD